MPLGGVLYRLFVPLWEYSSETKEKLAFSYRFLYCEKQFMYRILVCMFPIAGACAEFSCRPEIRGVAHRVTGLLLWRKIALTENRCDKWYFAFPWKSLHFQVVDVIF